MARLQSSLQFFTLLLVVILVTGPMIALPGAQLEIDDYRYLSLVQDVQSNPSAHLRTALIVRNSLDHLWWVERPFTVQYFRPWVFLTYWWDVVRSSDTVQALLVTNALIYAILCVAVWWLFRILFGVGWSTALGATLFAAFACHSEVLYYVAGRTDSLAALWIVLATCCHVTPRARWLAPMLYFFALGTKELALMTPLYCLLVDWANAPSQRLLQRLRTDCWVYVGYAGALAAFLVLRHFALPPSETALRLAPPYAPVETLPAWGEHLYVQIRAFLESIFWGVIPNTYQATEDFRTASSWWVGGALLALGGVWRVWRERAAQALLWIAVISYVPLTIVYFSERYFLIPTIAVSGAVVVLLRSANGRRGIQVFSRALVIVWIAHQALVCCGKNVVFTHPALPYQKEPSVLSRLLDTRRNELDGTKRLVVVSVPGHWVVHLFFEAFLRVHLGDPDIKVLLLTLWPTERGAAFNVQCEFLKRGVVRVSSEMGVMSVADTFAPTVSFAPTQSYTNARTGIQARVIAGQGNVLRSVEFLLPDDFKDAPILQFIPGGSPDSTRDEQLFNGEVTIINPPVATNSPENDG